MTFAELLDQVSETDRKWFEDHPEATEYTRPYVEGEIHPNVFPVMSGVCDKPMVRVVKVAPGVRARIPLFQTAELPEA